MKLLWWYAFLKSHLQAIGLDAWNGDSNTISQEENKFFIQAPILGNSFSAVILKPVCIYRNEVKVIPDSELNIYEVSFDAPIDDPNCDHTGNGYTDLAMTELAGAEPAQQGIQCGLRRQMVQTRLFLY